LIIKENKNKKMTNGNQIPEQIPSPSPTPAPAPTPTPTPTVYFPPAPPKKSKTGVVKIIIGIILIGIIVTGISLVSRIWDPLWNPFRLSPEKVMEKMNLEMEKLETLHSRTKLDIEVKGYTENPTTISLISDGDLDNTNPDNPKSAGSLGLTMTMEGMEFSLAGEAKLIGQDFYFKLNTLPALALLPISGIDYTQLKNQWIKTDIVSKEGINPEITKQIAGLFKDKKFYSVTKEFSDEKLDNQKTYHYLLTLNKEEIKKVLSEFLDTAVRPEQLAEVNVNKEELLSKISDFLEKMGDVSSDIWIGKKDLYLYQIKGEKEIDLSEFIEAGQTLKVNVKIESSFFNFDKPVTIEAPTDFKELEEILSEIMPKPDSAVE
jgi:hypothetical protein